VDGPGLATLAKWQSLRCECNDEGFIWQTWQTLPDLSPVASVRDLRKLPEDAVLP
jgi:hypothetical protein